MPQRKLVNMPLVEAILELRWELESKPGGVLIDPYYRLLTGRLQERLSKEYPAHEELPAATVPDEISAYTVKHRFRASAKGWPLVQVGPGILTLNDTSTYGWERFKPLALDLTARLMDAHPQRDQLKVNTLLLRYIDAVSFDFAQGSLLEFLQDNMRVSISLPDIFNGLDRRPTEFGLKCSFASTKPDGVFKLRFSSGRRNDSSEPLLLWETSLESKGTFSLTAAFETWLDDAHTTCKGVFFKLIEGKLERQFAGE